jgi:hypothetical protein
VLRYLGWSLEGVHWVANSMGWPTRWWITLIEKENS